MYPGCGPLPGDELSDTWSMVQPKIIQDGIEIPNFSSASAQLNHGASGFRNKKEKSAALRAVATLFPENRHACGHAAMALAYLHLEPDYRFARPIDIKKAANDFLAILEAYPSFPDIQAKARWYLGWIYTALDPQPDKGRAHFWTIVTDFFKIPMNLSPPAPWANLVYPESAAPSADPSGQKYWSQIALLEIIRQPGSPAEAIKAFDLLYDRFFMSTETGLALKSMLSTHELASHAEDRAEAYLAGYTANPYLTKDIFRLYRKTAP